MALAPQHPIHTPDYPQFSVRVEANSNQSLILNNDQSRMRPVPTQWGDHICNESSGSFDGCQTRCGVPTPIRSRRNTSRVCDLRYLPTINNRTHGQITAATSLDRLTVELRQNSLSEELMPISSGEHQLRKLRKGVYRERENVDESHIATTFPCPRPSQYSAKSYLRNPTLSEYREHQKGEHEVGESVLSRAGRKSSLGSSKAQMPQFLPIQLRAPNSLASMSSLRDCLQPPTTYPARFVSSKSKLVNRSASLVSESSSPNSRSHASPGRCNDSTSETDLSSDIASLNSTSSASESESSRTERLASPEVITSAQKLIIINRIMASMMARLNVKLASMHQRCHGTSEQAHGSHQVLDLNLGAQNSGSISGRSRKRSKQKDDDEASGDGNENDNRLSKKQKAHAPSEKYACPFFKHDRSSYRHWTSCCWPGFTSVHRMKEHLYRRHMLPKHRCPRCHENLKTDSALSQHLRATAQCELREEQVIEGITDEQETQLRVRKRKRNPSTERERWEEVYQVLFPHDSPIPSPFQDHFQMPDNIEYESSQALNRFEEYARREFPRLIRGKIENLVERIVANSVSHDAVSTMCDEVFTRMFQTFRHTEGSEIIQPQLPNHTINTQSETAQRLNGDGMMNDLESLALENLLSFTSDSYFDFLNDPKNSDSGYDGSWNMGTNN